MIITGSDIASIITASAALIAALTSAGAFILGMVNRRNIQDVKKATDGMKDQLVAATAKASLAEGTAVGLEKGRNEGTAAPTAPDVQKVQIVEPLPTDLKKGV